MNFARKRAAAPLLAALLLGLSAPMIAAAQDLSSPEAATVEAQKEASLVSYDGCVRLPAAFARKLYGVTRVGATVVITDEEVGPDDAVTASAPDPTQPETLAPRPIARDADAVTTVASADR